MSNKDFLYGKDNIFIKIANQYIYTPNMYQNNNHVAFDDVKPLGKIHKLIVPKDLFSDIINFFNKANIYSILDYIKILIKMIECNKLRYQNYKIMINGGQKGEQIVMQLHTHLIYNKNIIKNLINTNYLKKYNNNFLDFCKNIQKKNIHKYKKNILNYFQKHNINKDNGYKIVIAINNLPKYNIKNNFKIYVYNYLKK